MVAHACNPKTPKVKAERWGDQDQPQPHSKLEASLRMKLYLKIQEVWGRPREKLSFSSGFYDT